MDTRLRKIATLALAAGFIAGCDRQASTPPSSGNTDAVKTTTPASATGGLAGTSWQLVKFSGSNDSTLTPDDRSKYTITFEPDGSVTTRVDCNRGRGTWKSAAAGALQLGPLALTRAMCPPGSMHDRIAADWDAVRSYTIKDGHLFLALMADGGVYEYEPVSAPPPG